MNDINWDTSQELRDSDPFQCLANMMHEHIDEALKLIKSDPAQFMPNDLVFNALLRIITQAVMVNGEDIVRKILNDLVGMAVKDLQEVQEHIDRAMEGKNEGNDSEDVRGDSHAGRGSDLGGGSEEEGA